MSLANALPCDTVQGDRHVWCWYMKSSRERAGKTPVRGVSSAISGVSSICIAIGAVFQYWYTNNTGNTGW